RLGVKVMLSFESAVDDSEGRPLVVLLEVVVDGLQHLPLIGRQRHLISHSSPPLSPTSQPGICRAIDGSGYSSMADSSPTYTADPPTGSGRHPGKCGSLQRAAGLARLPPSGRLAPDVLRSRTGTCSSSKPISSSSATTR